MANMSGEGYLEPNVESLESKEVPAAEVPGPFVDSVDSEVPEARPYVEPYVHQDEAESESAAPKKTAAKKAAKKS